MRPSFIYRPVVSIFEGWGRGWKESILIRLVMQSGLKTVDQYMDFNSLMESDFNSNSSTTIFRGRSKGGAPGACPPLKLEKNMIFWRKILIFHTKYTKYFRASLCSVQFFLCVPPPPPLT